MWLVRWWQALGKADAITAIAKENVRLREALARAESDFECVLNELTDPATVRALPQIQDGLWRNVRDRCRVGRDEIRRALSGSRLE